MAKPAAVKEAVPSIRSRSIITRILRSHASIQEGNHPNARELAEEFEVNPKSIHRDLDFMRDIMGLPLEYSRKNHGFFYTRSVPQLPLLNISEGELFALALAEKALQQ